MLPGFDVRDPDRVTNPLSNADDQNVFDKNGNVNYANEVSTSDGYTSEAKIYVQ